MPEPTVTCPKCSAEIPLTESLAAPLLAAERRKYDLELAAKEQDIARREEGVKSQRRELQEAKRTLDDQVASQVTATLESERPRILAEESNRIKAVTRAEIDAKAREIAELNGILQTTHEKLTEANKAQADFLRKQRELDDLKRELDVTVEKRVTAMASEIQARARVQAEDALSLKITEKDTIIQGMQRQVEELRRKAEQGSQQTQGEAQELELEQLLASRFPSDKIEPVPKGEFGGDIVQTVINPLGHQCGTILWEAKRTKNWSDGWLAKLRDNQRTAKADLAVLMTQVLPKDIEHFHLLDGVYVVSPRCAFPLAVTLRQALMEVSMARQAITGQQTKMELVYSYLTGPRFRQRIQAIVETFSSLQEDLATERRVIQRQWAKREAQIDRVVESTAGLYGDLQGIAGRTLQEIEGLSLTTLGLPFAEEADAGGQPVAGKQD